MWRICSRKYTYDVTFTWILFFFCFNQWKMLWRQLNYVLFTVLGQWNQAGKICICIYLLFNILFRPMGAWWPPWYISIHYFNFPAVFNVYWNFTCYAAGSPDYRFRPVKKGISIRRNRGQDTNFCISSPKYLSTGRRAWNTNTSLYNVLDFCNI